MQLQLGENKTVELTGWVGSTKKNFMNLFKEKGENVAEQDVLGILVYPFITPNDIYYSEDELQYILINLRDISVKDDITFAEECVNEECNEVLDVSLKVSDIYSYTQSKYPSTDGKIAWRDIQGKNDLKDLVAKNENELPGNTEAYLHIESYDGNQITSFNQIQELVDELPLNESNDIIDNFDRNKSSIELSCEETCKCGEVNVFEFESIPSFFDPLLPKELQQK